MLLFLAPYFFPVTLPLALDQTPHLADALENGSELQGDKKCCFQNQTATN